MTIEEYKKKLFAYMFDLADGVQTREQEDELQSLRTRLTIEELESLKQEGTLRPPSHDVDSWLKRKGI